MALPSLGCAAQRLGFVRKPVSLRPCLNVLPKHACLIERPGAARSARRRLPHRPRSARGACIRVKSSALRPPGARALARAAAAAQVDRPSATAERCGHVESQLFDLFAQLGASEEQLDFPVLYASARQARPYPAPNPTITLPYPTSHAAARAPRARCGGDALTGARPVRRDALGRASARAARRGGRMRRHAAVKLPRLGPAAAARCTGLGASCAPFFNVSAFLCSLDAVHGFVVSQACGVRRRPPSWARLAVLRPGPRHGAAVKESEKHGAPPPAEQTSAPAPLLSSQLLTS